MTDEYQRFTKARIKAMIWMIVGIILLAVVIFCMELDGMDERTIECIIYGSLGSCGFTFTMIAASFEILKVRFPSKLQLLEERVTELEKGIK